MGLRPVGTDFTIECDRVRSFADDRVDAFMGNRLASANAEALVEPETLDLRTPPTLGTMRYGRTQRRLGMRQIGGDQPPAGVGERGHHGYIAAEPE